MATKITLQNLEKMDYARREAFNSLRTNLQFCGDDTRVIMLTSCTPNEGKSTVSIELARSLSEDGKKTILIDADLRKSVLVGRYRIHSDDEIYGLSHYLSGQKRLEEVISRTDVEHFDMIVSGPTAPNPTELLGKAYFTKMLEVLRQKYDFVLIDCPPLGWVIDAAVIAPACDGAILVVESNAISYRYLQEVKKQLEMTSVRILGAVLNKVKVQSGGYYNRYYAGHYKGYYNHYGKYGKYGKYGEYGEYGNGEENGTEVSGTSIQ